MLGKPEDTKFHLVDWVMMKSNIGKMLRPFSWSALKLFKSVSWANKRRIIFAENEEIQFEKFLDLLIYYMCARCLSDARKVYPRDAVWIGVHHNGLFTISLGREKIGDLYSGIMNSYRVYLENKENPVSIEKLLAEAFFEPPMPAFPNDNLHRTVKYFFLNRHSSFLRHGLEDLQKSEFKLGQPFPPKFSMKELSISIDGVSFAVELDTAPLTRCFAHGKNYQWHYCGGVMSLKDFKKLGGKLSMSGDRDHFYAKSDIELSNLYFLYRAETDGAKSLGFSPNLLRQNIQDIKSSGAGNIELNTIGKFFTVVNMLEQRIEAFEMLLDK